MPMVYQQNINPGSKLGVWHILEEEAFFKGVPLQRSITHPHKRLQHLAGRFLLKELYPGFPYELIKIADTRKPFLENEAFHFSISHCGDYAAVMVSTLNRVGVDVERISVKVDKVKHKFLSAAEQELVNKIQETSGKEPYTFLTMAWSIKEALFKWYGAGELDFIEDMHINEMNFSNSNGRAECSITKESVQHLTADLMLLGNECVCWVLS